MEMQPSYYKVELKERSSGKPFYSTKCYDMDELNDIYLNYVCGKDVSMIVTEVYEHGGYESIIGRR